MGAELLPQDERASGQHERDDRIVIGVHGVGSPLPGEVVQNIVEGYANAHPNCEVEKDATIVAVAVDGHAHSYRGARIRDAEGGLQIWEVNWADLKGFPDTSVGSLLYALKAIVAMIQIGDKGWDASSSGATGPLFFGRILRAFFCTFSLVAPMNLCMIVYAYLQPHATISYIIVGLFLIIIGVVLLALTAVDHLIRYSLVFLSIGGGAAGHGC